MKVQNFRTFTIQGNNLTKQQSMIMETEMEALRKRFLFDGIEVTNEVHTDTTGELIDETREVVLLFAGSFHFDKEGVIEVGKVDKVELVFKDEAMARGEVLLSNGRFDSYVIPSMCTETIISDKMLVAEASDGVVVFDNNLTLCVGFPSMADATAEYGKLEPIWFGVFDWNMYSMYDFQE